MEVIHEHLYALVKEKFGIEKGSISDNGIGFIFKNEAGEVIATDKNFTEEEIFTAKKSIEKEWADAKENRATAKAALLDKLGITAEEAQLLLGGN